MGSELGLTSEFVYFSHQLTLTMDYASMTITNETIDLFVENVANERIFPELGDYLFIDDLYENDRLMIYEFFYCNEKEL